jgi:hypothetical protein
VNKFYTISLLLLISIGIKSQSFNAGISGGINASQISGDGYSGFDKAGILFGVYSNAPISNKLNIQLEINYSQKGSRRNQTDENPDFLLLRLNYVEVPILVRWESKKITYEAGLYYGQLIHQYLEDENFEYVDFENFNQFKSTDFGASIGLTYKLSEHLMMNWRYNNSINSVRDFNSGAQFGFKRGMMHSYMSFSIRYELLGENEK